MPRAYFTARNSSGMNSLWVTDGTTAGTYEITGVLGANATSGLNPADLAALGQRIAFSGSGTDQRGVWLSDGTAAGTIEINIPTTNPPSSNPQSGPPSPNATGGLLPHDLTAFGDRVLFFGTSAPHHHGTFITDG